MTELDPIATLHERSTRLRALAQLLERLAVLDLSRSAGPDTWTGPAARACVNALGTVRTNVLRDATSLRSIARRLDQQAGG